MAKLAEHPAEALALASIKKATRDPSKKDFVDLVKSATNSEKDKIKKINFPIKMKTEDALSLKIQCDLSDEQYQIIRNSSIIHNVDIYPSLHEIKNERHKCYPEGLIVTETSASTSLQGMFNHTLTRILTFTECQESMRMFAEIGGRFKGLLHFKGGFDGASSQSVYKQKYTDTNIGEAQVNEQSLFQTAVVPLKLTIMNKNVWLNKKPSSTHYCRPLHLQYQKETEELIRNKYELLKAKINRLVKFEVKLEVEEGKPDTTITFKFKLDLTMFDGKVVNALTNTLSSQSCNVCGAKPSELNNPALIRSKPINEKALSLGLSTLHCWLRCFEYILHLGYKLDIKKFFAKSPAEKALVKSKKTNIQLRFREELSLIVDMPKQSFGNTNDGNTARRAFENAETFADITGVAVDVIIRLRTILIAVCSCYELNSESFGQYCYETTALILKNYCWYVIPPTVHKLLEHGVQISEALKLPIGYFSEESQEALNKEIRKARLNHTAKISRKNVMKNQYQYLLIRSDPVISNTCFKKYKFENGKTLTPEVLSLLML